MGNYRSDQKNAKFYGLKISRNTDCDIIKKLESVENVQGYLKDLIRKDIIENEKGVSQGAVGKWEQGMTIPRPRHIVNLSALLEIPVEDLLKVG